LERVIGATDLESRTHDVAIIQEGKKNEREFMCETPNGVNQHVRQSSARTCGHRGLGERDWWGIWEACGHESL